MLTTTSTSNSLANGSAAQASATVAPQAASDENRDMFTRLLVAQIQNQDPLSPQDPSTYVNQLSQLSQTEALQNLAQMSTANASILQNMQTLAMGSQVGAEVTVATNVLKLDGGKVSGSIQLNGASSATTLVLTGLDGQQHKVELGAHGSGAQSFTIDPDALGLAPGSYAIQAIASNGSAPQIEVAARLNSVRIANGSVVLQVQNLGEVDPAYVTGFNGKTAS